MILTPLAEMWTNVHAYTVAWPQLIWVVPCINSFYLIFHHYLSHVWNMTEVKKDSNKKLKKDSLMISFKLTTIQASPHGRLLQTSLFRKWGCAGELCRLVMIGRAPMTTWFNHTGQASDPAMVWRTRLNVCKGYENFHLPKNEPQ